MSTDKLWLALYAAAKEAAIHRSGGPRPPCRSELAVTQSWTADRTCISHLVEHGMAPLNADGSGPTREVWDIMPIGSDKIVRWENADFYALPPKFVALVEAMLAAGLLPKV